MHPATATATTTTVALRASSTASSSTVVTTAAPRAKPSAPRTAVATATGSSGQIRLAWYAPSINGGSAITDYVIQRSANGGSAWTTIADGVNTSTTYTVNGLTNGTRYHFRVYARNAIGSSPAGNVTTAIPVNALTAPRSLVAVPTNVSRQLRLTWTAPLSNGGRAITDYIIQRSSNGSTGWTTITDGAGVSTAYTVTGLTDGTRYFFRIFARTSTATGPSSTIVNAVPRTKPSAPRSTTAAPNNLSGQVRLTWVAPSSNGGAAITDYVIQRSSNGTTWTNIADGVGTATSYTATGLANGSRYYFRVLAKNGAGIGAASVTVNAVPRTVPTAPRGLWGRSDTGRVLPRLGRAGLQRRERDHRLHPRLVEAVRRLAKDRRRLPQRDVGLRGREGRLRAVPGGGHQRRRGGAVQHHQGVLIGAAPFLLPGLRGQWDRGVSCTISQRPSIMAATAVNGRRTRNAPVGQRSSGVERHREPADISRSHRPGTRPA